MRVEVTESKKTPNRSFIKVVRSVRQGKQVKRVVVHNLGYADNDFLKQQLIAAAQVFIEQLQKVDSSMTDKILSSLESAQSQGVSKFITLEHPDKNIHSWVEQVEANENERVKNKRKIITSQSLSLPPNLKESYRLHDGSKIVYSFVYEQIFQQHGLSSQEASLIENLVIARIIDPSSKLKTRENLEKKMGVRVSSDAIYRSLDQILLYKDKFNEDIFQFTKSFCKGKIDLLLYDVTTLYTESVVTDGLREFGYSKDSKFHQTQVTLALACTKEGLPLAYKLFPGNTAETATLHQCIDEWSQSFTIDNVVYVADAAMFSSKNLKTIHERKEKFIVSARIKSMNKETKHQILEQVRNRKNKEGFLAEIPYAIELKEEKPPKKSGKLKASTPKEFIYGRLVIGYSESRASKDRRDRAKLIEKLKHLQGKKESEIPSKKLITNSGYLKFTKLDKESVAQMDFEKIQEEAQWDGVYAYFTNSEQEPLVIMALYRNQFVIEEVFRLHKTNLKMRPVYHFKSRRIQAHVQLCFMAFSVLRFLQRYLELKNIRLSPAKIRDELEQVQASILTLPGGGIYRLPSNLSPTVIGIFKALGLSHKTRLEEIPITDRDYTCYQVYVESMNTDETEPRRKRVRILDHV